MPSIIRPPDVLTRRRVALHELSNSPAGYISPGPRRAHRAAKYGKLKSIQGRAFEPISYFHLSDLCAGYRCSAAERANWIQPVVVHRVLRSTPPATMLRSAPQQRSPTRTNPAKPWEPPAAPVIEDLKTFFAEHRQKNETAS